MQEERNDLNAELLSKKELEPKDLENSQPSHIVKNKPVCLGENTKGVASDHLLGSELRQKWRQTRVFWNVSREWKGLFGVWFCHVLFSSYLCGAAEKGSCYSNKARSTCQLHVNFRTDDTGPKYSELPDNRNLASARRS